MSTTIIAEIGCNHQGNFAIACDMINEAIRCGVPAVKLQKRDLSSIQNPHRPYTGPHSFGDTYGEHRAALEFSLDQHIALSRIARTKGAMYGLSVWDEMTLAQIFASDSGWLDFIKIPSALASNVDFIDSAANTGKPLIISFGMSTKAQVMAAGLVSLTKNRDTYALQCTSAYPCDNNQINLRVIPWLKSVLPWAGVGLSGHHRGIQIDAAAVALGATIIERHFTLDRTSKGTDHAASLEPHGLAALVRDVHAVEEAMGTDEKTVLDCERPALEKLRGTA